MIGHDIELIRKELPEVMAGVTQVILDNPGQFALLAAADIVMLRILARAVRPRSPLELAAVLAVATFGLPLVNKTAIDRGLIRVRMRDADGCLVPYVPGE